MRRIAVEEHFITAGYLAYLRGKRGFPRRVLMEQDGGPAEQLWYTSKCCFTMPNPDAVNKYMIGFGETRLEEMDAAGIDVQVLSLTAPGVETLTDKAGIKWAQRTNDEIALAIKEHPGRYAGFAAIPFQAPSAAADELDRAVKDLGLCGAMINSNVRGQYLDEKKFWPVFEKAEELGVPIYLHPKEPSPDMIKPFMAYPVLWSALWGFGAEAGLHVMRLICSGVFDKYPQLKIIIGHMGEGFPYWMWRLDKHWKPTPMAKKLARKPSEYLRENFYMTTSGMFYEPALMCAYQAMGADNMLFAVDYPYESSKEATQFLDSAPIPESDKQKIYHLNAEKLLGL
jgi:5-carboxyvanillate decarboxylase